MGIDIEAVLKKMQENPASIKFKELEKVCDHFFERRKSKGTSHITYKTPWEGDPRVNIQNNNGSAKTYQVRQVSQAVEKLHSI